jgi:NitT/TauT family transport system substrate-binding protein
MMIGSRRGGLALATVMLGVLAVLAACASGAAPAPSAASARPAAPAAAPDVVAPSATLATAGAELAPLDPPARVRIGSFGAVSERGIFIALERGYFAAEGLDVELIPLRTDQVAALLTGDLDFGISGVDGSVFNAALRGVGVKVVCYNITFTPGDISAGFVVRKEHIDSGRYRELKDFQGYTIALRSSASSLMHRDHLMARAGLTPEDVQTVTLDFPAMVPALANRAVDAAYLAEPFISIAEAQGVAQQVMPMGDLEPNSIGSVMMISPRFAEQQPEAARRFVTAHMRGQRDYYRAVQLDEGGRDEIVQILIKHTPIKDPNLYTKLLTSAVDPNSEMDPRPLEALQDYYLKLGVVPQKVDVRTQILDRSYAEYALQRLGRLP